jgi:hypothetical protein
MYRNQDGSYHYDEEDRIDLHESAHCLVDLIFTGTTSTIDKDERGGASCRKVWDPDLPLASDKDDTAFLLWGVHTCLAGYMAEEKAFLTADIRGCAHDLQVVPKALQILEENKLALKRSTVQMLLKYWLTVYARPWRALAGTLQVGRTVSEKSKHVLLTYDNSGTLREYAADPLLAGPDWREKYLAVKDVAVQAYARERLGFEATLR